LKSGKEERVLGKFSPRWMALSKLINNEKDNQSEQHKTSAIMIAGNSQNENEIGFANGFPKTELKRGEIIIV